MKTPVVMLSLLPHAKHSIFKAYLIRFCHFVLIHLGISQMFIAVSSTAHLSLDSCLHNLRALMVAQQQCPKHSSIVVLSKAKSLGADHIGHPIPEGRRFFRFHLQQRPLLGWKHINLANAGYRTILSSFFGQGLCMGLLSVIITN